MVAFWRDIQAKPLDPEHPSAAQPFPYPDTHPACRFTWTHTHAQPESKSPEPQVHAQTLEPCVEVQPVSPIFEDVDGEHAHISGALLSAAAANQAAACMLATREGLPPYESVFQGF